MGNIAFTIDKVVTLDKTVNLVIDKNVEVNVDIDDLLATAEADAEAFGKYALAETDAYTYVREIPGEGEPVCEDNPGSIDVLGNSPIIDEGDDNFSGFDPVTGDGINGPDGFFDTLSINLDGEPQVELPDGTFVPDVDDINGFGALSNVNAPPPPPPVDLPDAPLPIEGILSITDLNLEQTGNILVEDFEAEYRSTEDWVVNFGERTIHCDQFGEGFESDLDPVTGQLLLTVPAGTLYAAEFPGGDDVEIEFESFVDGDGDGVIDPAFFTFAGQDYDVTDFVFDAESIEEFVGDYAFEAAAVFGQCCHDGGGPRDGEAFSYAESTAAIDLNGNGNDMIPTAEVI